MLHLRTLTSSLPPVVQEEKVSMRFISKRRISILKQSGSVKVMNITCAKILSNDVTKSLQGWCLMRYPNRFWYGAKNEEKRIANPMSSEDWLKTNWKMLQKGQMLWEIYRQWVPSLTNGIRHKERIMIIISWVMINMIKIQLKRATTSLLTVPCVSGQFLDPEKSVIT